MIETMFERSRVNAKFREVLLKRLRATFHTLPLFYLRPVKNAHRLHSGYQSSIEKPILSIYFNSIYSYCIMYKVDVEESSGERTSRELMSH